MDQRVRVVEEPSPIVTWADVKAHVMIEDDSEKAYVEALIAAATSWIDGPTGWLGRSLGAQVLELRSSSWPNRDDFALPFPPLIEILSIKYIDLQGEEREWPVSDALYWDNLPAVRGREGDVSIRYRAGYAILDNSDPQVWVNAAPAPVRVAIMMMVAQWYRSREPIAIGASVEALPFAVDALLQPFRIYS